MSTAISSRLKFDCGTKGQYFDPVAGGTYSQSITAALWLVLIDLAVVLAMSLVLLRNTT